MLHMKDNIVARYRWFDVQGSTYVCGKEEALAIGATIRGVIAVCSSGKCGLVA